MSISGIPSSQYQNYPLTGGNTIPTTNPDGSPGVGGGNATGGQSSVPGTSPLNRSIGFTDITGGSTAGSNVSTDHAEAVMNLVSQLVTQLWQAPLAEIDELARVVVEEAAAQSRQALDQSRNQADAAKAELMSQAGALRQEASEMMAGAIASLVMTVVSSAISIGSATGQLKMMASVKAPGGEEFEKMSPEEQKEAKASYQTEVQKVNTEVGAYNMLTSGITQFTQGLGTFVNTIYQAEAKETEAKSAEDAANAQQLQSYSDQSQKIAQDLGKLADQIIAILKEINDAKAQMMQAMTRV